MAKAKRQITFKKKKVEEQEKPVTTIPQNTENNAATEETSNVPTEIEKQAQNVFGDVGGSKVVKPV